MSGVRDYAAIRVELESALKEATPDFSQILRLSREIAETDADALRFSTDAGMIRRLGRELVARQETALAELVKNAYDADATEVTVTLSSGTDGSQSLVISDNGNGMTRTQLVNGFMRLASDDKLKYPVSPRFHRKRAGRKGIGRFATERLGDKLTLTTTTADTATLKLIIDWKDFDSGIDLDYVPNRVAELSAGTETGTKLTIECLRDSWSDTQLHRVFRYVATLLQPFGMALEEESGAGAGDPGFHVSFLRGASLFSDPKVVADQQTEIIGRALATVHAHIDGVGRATWSLESVPFELSLVDQPIGLDREEAKPLEFARNARLTAYYYIFLPELLGPANSMLRSYLSENGGIRLYRNGYRVPPYGEAEDDWLGLDAIYAKRGNTLSPIANRNFLGLVEISDSAGLLFEETSSREGLIETDAYRELRELFSAVLVTVVNRIESKRGLGKKSPTRLGTVTETRGREFIERIESALTNFAKGSTMEQTSFDPSVPSSSVSDAKELVLALKEGQDVARERDALVEENNLLRILASMGLTLAEFSHDFAALAQTLEIDVNLLCEESKGQPRLEAAAVRLTDQFRLARAYTRYFAEMTSNNARRETVPIDLQAFAESFRDGLQTMFRRNGVELTVLPSTEYDLFTVPMHLSEWSSILLNLLTNSLKAIRRARTRGRVQVSIGSHGAEEVFLDFSDNGDGISEAIRDRIFDPFFTTSTAPPLGASDQVYALGTGLGLKIASDIVASVGGSIDLVTAPDGFATCFRVIVRRHEGDVQNDQVHIY